jgi:hypothetical protein
MTQVTVSQNDYGYVFTFTVENADGTAKDLTGYTVTLKLLRGTTVVSLGACVVTDAEAGECTYLVKSTDFPSAGWYSAELELTKTGTQESSEAFDMMVAVGH